MDRKTIIHALCGIAATLTFLVFTMSIRDSKLILFQIRFIGIISYMFLMTTILLGETRMLFRNKAEFALFRWHKPIAILSLYFVTLHMISAVADNFSRGKNLGITSYLGFSFSDNWLVFLSLGTLAFYMMIVVGISSATKCIQKLSFKRWRVIHYLSYPAFVMAHLHAINIGTDLRSGFLSLWLRPFFVLSFLIIISLLVTRIFAGIRHINEQAEINLALIFFLILIIGSAFAATMVTDKINHANELESDKQTVLSQVDKLEDVRKILIDETVNSARGAELT